MTDRTLLLINTDPFAAKEYRAVLCKVGYRTKTAESAETALKFCHTLRPRVAILDLRHPGLGGPELMAECLRMSPETRFILLSHAAPMTQVVETVRAGAFDYLTGVIDEKRLLASVTAAMTDAATVEIESRQTQTDLIGRSPQMLDVFTRVAAISPSKGTVFITGESGTGKELCAKAVHENSERAKGPFIALNCGGIPRDLLESEVFGHVRGAFTGAVSDRPGAAVLADGGTLFLDEICELDPSIQAKLLRFLETSTVMPVGANHPRKVDVRIVCATNRDATVEIAAGRFREDLYYRIHVLPIHMPPLRERGTDVLEIAEHVLRKLSKEEGRTFDRFSDGAAQAFLRYEWPGNVRQLINILRQIVVMNKGPSVELHMLPAELSTSLSKPAKAIAINGDARLPELIGRSMAEIEQLIIEATISDQGGSIPRAAEILQMSPSTIYRKKAGW